MSAIVAEPPTSTYSESGVVAVDDLYHSEADLDGKIYWNEGSDGSTPWTVTYQKQLFNNTTQAWVDVDGLQNSGTTPIETIIDEYKNNPNSIPAEPIRYILTYTISDESNNTAYTTRTVELRNSPNIDPQMTVSDGDGNGDENFYTIDISENYSEPTAIAFIEYGGNLGTVPLVHSKQYRWIDSVGNVLESFNSYLDSQHDRVNFYTKNGVDYYVDENKDLHSPGSSGWKQLVLRFYAEDENGNSIEKNSTIRRTDIYPPTITLAADGSGFSSFEAGLSFTDTGIDSVVNYGEGVIEITVSIKSNDDHYSKGPFTFTTNADSFAYQNNLSGLIFDHPDTYTISYQVIDDLNNTANASYS